jgi:hypothetical protein
MVSTKDKVKEIDRLKKNRLFLKIIIERLFLFSDVDSYFEGIDSNIGNIPCKFHGYEGYGENRRSPASKMYYNEERDLYTIHCYTSGKTYTVYDYIEKVLDEDPLTYLKENRDINDIYALLENLQKGYINQSNDFMEKKIMYVDNTLDEVDYDIVEYIEALYNS